MPDLIAVSDKLFSYISDLRDEKSTKKYSSNLRTPSPRK
jgi:hypothetical protein